VYLYIIIIFTQRDDFRRALFVLRTFGLAEKAEQTNYTTRYTNPDHLV